MNYKPEIAIIEPNTLCSLGLKSILEEIIPCPVSYTHLDVYKRQANRRSLQRPPYRAHSMEMLPSTGSCIVLQQIIGIITNYCRR